MKDLPPLYARVVAKRPELAVPMLKIDTSPPGWSLCGSWCGEHFAAALILARWVEWLPEGFCITKTKMSDGGIAWIVAKDMDDSFAQFCADTHIEALAAFYLGEENP